MTSINTDSPISYYQQLYTILRKEIDRGTWKPGERMPSEAELITAYGVSRITVRQAFDLLVDDGLIYRRRGSGTFIAKTPVEFGRNHFVSFAEDMHRRGLKPETRVVAARLEPASREIAARLNIETGCELAVLHRLRLANGKPMSVERAHLVHRFCPGILDGDYADSSLYEALRDRFGIRLARASEVIKAVAADKALAEVLTVPAKSPLVYIERVAFRQAGIPFEYLQCYYRGDRYALYNELHA